MNKIARLASVFLLLCGAGSAFAFTDEWAWTVTGVSGGPWPTKTQAIAAMHAAATSSNRYDLLVNETKLESNQTHDTYLYEADRIAPTITDWRYQKESGGNHY